MIFVVDDLLWENTIDSLVKITFGTAIDGVNQTESLFKVIQINHSELKSILKTHTNIVIVLEGVVKSSRKNKWAKNQFVAQLNWGNNHQKLLKELAQLRELVTLKEVRSIKKDLKKSSQKNIEQALFNSFGVECIIPKKYEIVNNTSAFFWANYDPKKSDEIKNILMFSFVPKTKNIQSEVLFKTDSVFAKHLIGPKENSFVCIEKDYPPFYFQNTYRGLWKLENGFMGGPFLIKTYFIKNKIVVNVGLVFDPQGQKRKHIKEKKDAAKKKKEEDKKKEEQDNN